MKEVTNINATDSGWNWHYTSAGVAALLSAVFIPIQVAVFIIWPPPSEGRAIDWFRLLEQNRIAGLIDLDLLLVADNLLLIPIFLALYVALRRTNETIMALAMAFGLLGVVMYVATNPAFEMLSLSTHYAATTSEGERAIFLAAGQAMLTTWEGTAFHVAYFVGTLAGIAVGVVMLQSNVFGKAIAYMAILGNAIGLGLYVPVVGVYISVFSVLFLEVWYILLAGRFFQLGQGASRPEAYVHAEIGASPAR